jgi:hypothetical protein
MAKRANGSFSLGLTLFYLDFEAGFFQKFYPATFNKLNCVATDHFRIQKTHLLHLDFEKLSLI